ncbi:hypothetical protein EV424DRAFT_1425284 [Suillus variegatus]|nr:hypothetical protein EV424DRAFT_1425284 [Suillus variegatus]
METQAKTAILVLVLVTVPTCWFQCNIRYLRPPTPNPIPIPYIFFLSTLTPGLLPTTCSLLTVLRGTLYREMSG